MSSNDELWRRQFLQGLLAATTAALLPTSLRAQSESGSAVGDRAAPESLARARALIGEGTLVDFHTHLGLWHTIGLNAPDRALPGIDEAKLGANVRELLAAGCKCVYLDTISDIARTRLGQPGNKDRDFRDDEAWEDYLRQYGLIREFLERLPLALAEAPAEVPSIAASGKLAVILSTEGAHMLENDASRIDTLYAQGLRRIQPIHYVATTLGDSQTDPETYGGLSARGREVVERAAERGMLLDMAHASLAVVEQTAALVDKPLALSHTFVKYNSERYGDYAATRARWVTPAHARLIADTGGVIGTFPAPAPYGVATTDAFVEALLVMVDTVGIDHVAWSTDMVDVARPEFLRDYRQFAVLCARLLERGFSDDDLLKFMGANALRVQAEA